MFFHGFNITLDESETDQYTLNEKRNAKNTVFTKFVENCANTLLVDIPDETEYITLMENIEHDDNETMKLNAFQTLCDFGTETLKFHHIYYHESPDTKHSMHCVIMQLHDSRTCIDQGIDTAIENVKLMYHDHMSFHNIKLGEGDYHSAFNDNNNAAKRWLGLGLLRAAGFKGPQDYDAVINKKMFSENVRSFCYNVPLVLKETKEAYFETDTVCKRCYRKCLWYQYKINKFFDNNQ